MNVSSNLLPSRREIRQRDRRDSIIAVATKWFLEYGYAGTTMTAISIALGGSRGTLWSYFDSKEVLFGAVIDSATAAFRAQLTEILEPSDDLVLTLRRFCIGFLERATSPDALSLYRLVVAEAGRSPEIGQIFFERAPRQTWEMLGTVLSLAMERGELRRSDPIDTARLLCSLCLSRSHTLLLLGEIKTLAQPMIERDAEHALEIFLLAFAQPVGLTARPH